MTSFQYDPLIIEAFPDLRGGVIVASGMTNGPAPPDLAERYRAEQAAAIARIGATPLSELPSLRAWRRAFSSFGVSPTKYRSAAEALLRRLTKKGDIPAISALVDIGNMVSIRYALPVAIFDLSGIATPITVHYSGGSKSFTELSSAEVMRPAAGEVVFSDADKMVVARRWCWRQSRTSAAKPSTTGAVITIEAQHPGGRRDIEKALQDLEALLEEFAGGVRRSAVLDADCPAI